jgi:hypothetical protein
MTVPIERPLTSWHVITKDGLELTEIRLQGLLNQDFNFKAKSLFDFSEQRATVNMVVFESFVPCITTATFPDQNQIMTSIYSVQVNATSFLAMPVKRNFHGATDMIFHLGRIPTKSESRIIKPIEKSLYEAYFPLLVTAKVDRIRYLYMIGGNNHGTC